MVSTRYPLWDRPVELISAEWRPLFDRWSASSYRTLAFRWLASSPGLEHAGRACTQRGHQIAPHGCCVPDSQFQSRRVRPRIGWCPTDNLSTKVFGTCWRSSAGWSGGRQQVKQVQAAECPRTPERWRTESRPTAQSHLDLHSRTSSKGGVVQGCCVRLCWDPNGHDRPLIRQQRASGKPAILQGERRPESMPGTRNVLGRTSLPPFRSGASQSLGVRLQRMSFYVKHSRGAGRCAIDCGTGSRSWIPIRTDLGRHQIVQVTTFWERPVDLNRGRCDDNAAKFPEPESAERPQNLLFPGRGIPFLQPRNRHKELAIAIGDSLGATSCRQRKVVQCLSVLAVWLRQ